MSHDTVAETESQAQKNEVSLKQARKLMEISSCISLFRTPGGDKFARVPVRDHFEVWPIRSQSLKYWLTYQYTTENGGYGPTTNAVNNTLQALESKAHFSPDVKEVYLRVAYENNTLYIDLGNAAWEVVEVTERGWKVVQDSPVMFRRTNGMLPIPSPERGGSLKELKQVINYGEDENQWRLLVGWLIGAYHPTGPYPNLVLQGEQGSAKTSAIRYLRGLIDPNTAPTNKQPADKTSMNIKAYNNWVVALDNISSMPQWLSDLLCGLNTGSGDGARRLYTDDEQVVFSSKRPSSINGIEDLATAGDLADRSVIVQLPVIDKKHRRSEDDLNALYEEMRPRVFGAVLDALSCALRKRRSIHLEDLPRMADFTIWVTAAEEALEWPERSFYSTYHKNRDNNRIIEIESSHVGSAVLNMLDEKQKWEGTAKDLLEALKPYASVEAISRGKFPVDAARMSGQLRRIAPALRDVGIGVEFSHSGVRTITLHKTDATSNGEDADRSLHKVDSVHAPDRPKQPKTGMFNGVVDAMDAKKALIPSVPHSKEKEREEVILPKTASTASTSYEQAQEVALRVDARELVASGARITASDEWTLSEADGLDPFMPDFPDE